MVKKWQKKLDKLDRKLSEKLYLIVKDIIFLNLDWYDIDTIKWEKNKFRIRQWKIRIIFEKTEKEWIIENIDFRWGVYK